MKIEKNIPIPQKFDFVKKVDNYAFIDRMEVGDSVFYRNEPLNRVSSRLQSHFKARGFKLAARTVKGGTRVWRVQ